jgi:hypothetical protein
LISSSAGAEIGADLESFHARMPDTHVEAGSTKKPGNQLSFPPLAQKFNPSGTVGTWPGAEFTRRTKLKTRCIEEYSSEFLEEMRAHLGERGFDHYQKALQPSVSRRLSRGKPPEEGAQGAIPIQPSAKLVREGGELSQTMGSSTTMVDGLPSRVRCLELTKTPWGDVPSHMFDNKPANPVASLDEWFLEYGRPTPSGLNLGPKSVYTTYEPISKRVCGAPSLQQKMKKGCVTA